MKFDSTKFRAQFPALKANDVYLDSASTSLKPQVMINALTDYYTNSTATILRSKHSQGLALTEQFEQTRSLVAKLINTKHNYEIVWTKGATESINLIAQSYARLNLKATDEIIVSELEHHSNLIPWLQVAQQTGARVIKWPIEQDGSLSNERLLTIVTQKTRIIAVTQMSNVTGFQPDIKTISHIAHQHNAIIVVDGAQGVVHQSIDVHECDIDFYAFSAHKLYGPTGLGILYGKETLLTQMDCGQGGGKMLKSASFSGFEPADLPHKFEAGTPNIASVIGFSSTLNWLLASDNLIAQRYTHQLVDYAKHQLSALLPQLKIVSVVGCPLLTFTSQVIHHDDIAILLAEQNIAIRAGELCAQPLMSALNYTGVVRASFMPYNNQEDVDRLISGLQSAIDILE